MRKIILTSFLLSLFTTTFAGDGKSFVSLKSSISIPFSDYRLNDFDKGCFTRTGVSFGAEGAWFLYKNLGVGLDVSYSLHTVDAVGIATEMVKRDPFLTYMTVRSDPYSMLAIMSGFYYSINLGKRISFQPKLMGGIIFGKTPYQLFEQTYLFPGPSYYKSTPSRDYSFAFKTGFSINYNINGCISIGINADYTNTHLSFGFITSNGFEYRERNINYIDFGLGLMIML
ncbi:MAG: hypothetical protein QM503_05155 [Bacteroidota bacterium]